jgi:hypothetical protein
VESQALLRSLALLENRYRDLLHLATQHLATKEKAGEDEVSEGDTPSMPYPEAQAQPQGLVVAHSQALKEIDVLKRECARRYSFLRLSQEQAAVIAQLQSELEEARRIQTELQRAPSPQILANEGTLRAPEIDERNDSNRVTHLEQELKEAREETFLLRQQVRHLLDELEEVFQKSQGSEAAPQANPSLLAAQELDPQEPQTLQETSASINAHRLRLLATAEFSPVLP